MPRNYYIQTLGCQMNYSDSERIDAVLQNLGLNKTDQMEGADLILFNTCSIKQKAEDKVLGQMKKITQFRKERPHIIAGITGCMVRKTSTRESEEKDKLVKRLTEIDMVFRIEDLPKLPKLIKDLWPETHSSELLTGSLENYFNINPIYSNKAQAFVPIGTGCDNFCTYCIVPYSRHREKSRPISEIVKECEKLVKSGCLEITLLGQNVNSYGISDHDKKTDMFKDYENPFVELLTQIDKLKSHGLKRLRFTSNHPKDLSDALINAMAQLETLMPYIHLPVQSGNDAILKKMNRNYTVEWYKELVAKLRKAIPDIAITTDIIVGFCSETQDQFQDTISLYKDVHWDMCYLSKYSDRIGTFASSNLPDDVSREDKADRWHRLNEVLKQIAREQNQKFKGRTVEVLVEKCRKGICEGRSEHFKTVTFTSSEDLTGQIVKVKVLNPREWLLEGEIIS
ncbi:tRNA (N6-isopentenyl adenosine(37)-C2)-methylthiotransferase MiaB [Patescibacteria group bacterium]